MEREEDSVRENYSVRISENALINIDEIVGYIAFIKHQPDNATKVGDALYKKIERIAIHPHVYRECEGLTTKAKIYRKANCLSWQIIFKINSLEVLILGIIHHSRKPSGLEKLKKIK